MILNRKHQSRENPPIDIWSRKELIKVMTRGDPVCVTIEINKRCAGGCLYCYASSTSQDELGIDDISFDTFKNILRISKLGVKFVYLYGGDQLLHPDLKEMVFHGLEKGFHLAMPLAGLIPANHAEWLVEAHEFALSKDLGFFVGIHIDSLDQDVYNTVNCFPNTLQAKIKGFQTLLDAGFPVKYTYATPTFTKQTGETIIELMDWFYSIGTPHVALAPFKPIGLSEDEAARWEPRLSQLKRFIEHRAEVEGKHMLLVGTADGKYACQSHIAITADGEVIPCLLFRDMSAGNIYREDIVKIVKKNKKKLLLKFKVKGPCGSCMSRHVCYGCRASAYCYAGDITASDPKCPYNPKAPETVFKQ
ncbi:MAG: radical SAM/SPASM domain-containing protein [Candidatus Helarchaeota archaeon]